jgi:two-component system, OmpR family, heavy metal sensor histidine kinase CusS
MQRLSLTLRLTLYFGVISAAILLAIGYSVGVAVDRHFAEEDRMELNGKREMVEHLLADVRSSADLDTIPRRIDDALMGHQSLVMHIVGADGALLFATPGTAFPATLLADPGAGASAALPPLLTWEDGRQAYRGIVVRAPTRIPGIAHAIVGIAVNIDHHRMFLAAFYRNLWLAIAAAIVLAGLLGWGAARRGLAPVREMADVARSITASRLHDRLPLATLPSELVDLATSFNDMLSRLEDSFRRLSEFSSDLAHELRTPVTNLMTQTQVALSRSRSIDEYREVLYSNAEEYERLARMITDMLFLAKADNGLIVPPQEAIDVAREVRELFEFFDALAEEKGIALVVTGDGTLFGDRLMIRRAISNLLANAIDHAPRGGSVDVRIEPANGGALRIAVANPGEGIAAEHLPRLFDRFFRVDPSRRRSTDGAGLGLAIVKSIVVAHRGEVRARSDAGRTTFEMVFPLRVAG